jgi:hypothetical protein
MHDVTTSHWHEPKGFKNAGYGAWKRPNTPYDDFMEEQDIPIYRGIGVKRVQDLPLQPWRRMGGRGTFIQLFGTEGLWGSYVVEVPGRGALNAERHMYEEVFLVVEGRGTTRNLVGRASQAEKLRMAEGLDVFGAAQHVAPYRQRGVFARADSGRYHRSQCHQSVSRQGLDLQFPHQHSVAL